MRDKKTEEDFNNWPMTSVTFLFRIQNKFDDKELQLLSPGQKGIVLLLVYRKVEQEDNRQLITDQPEDILDSRAVYASLIDYFRKRKKKCQIIIITHNPNLVLKHRRRTDSDSPFRRRRQPTIDYRNGALEERGEQETGGQPSIREEICRELEGGEEAFMRREKKYSFGAP